MFINKIHRSKDGVVLSVNQEISGDKQKYEIIGKYDLIIKTKDIENTMNFTHTSIKQLSDQLDIDENRIEKSIGLSIVAYLFILKMQHQDIPENQSWSIFSLREKFRHRVMKNQFSHDYKLLEGKLKNAA